MEADQASRCVPVLPVPPGVEGDAARKKTEPFKVRQWDRQRDADLRRLEDMARDGLRVANLQSFVMAHLLRALTDDAFVLSQQERIQTIETLKELQHMTTKEFGAISAQSVLTRRACAAQALNFPDRKSLLGAPFGRPYTGLRHKEQKRTLDRMLLLQQLFKITLN